MKLSDAIREGAKLRPQGFGDFFGVWGTLEKPETFTSCAVGAALEVSIPLVAQLLASGSVDGVLGFRGLEALETFPALKRQGIGCPVPDCKDEYGTEFGQILLNVIAHLNDVHRWTREQIADWLVGLDL